MIYWLFFILGAGTGVLGMSIYMGMASDRIYREILKKVGK